MKHRSYLFLLLAFISILPLKSQTDGMMTFSVRTTTNSGFYSPENILAIWLETSGGSFIKTFKVRASTRIQHLYTWKVISGLNMVDAVTGPTLPNHQIHTVTWNCRNLSNQLMPDGEYRIRVEFTEEHQQGPVATYSFTKNTASQTISFPDQSYFKDVTLTYTPITGIEQTEGNLNVMVFPNPFIESVKIQFKTPDSEPCLFRVFDRNGAVVFSSESLPLGIQHTEIRWNGRMSNGGELPSGTYYFSVKCGQKSHFGKILKIR